MSRKRRGTKARFTIGGKGVTPQTVDVREVAKDLLALDAALRSIGNIDNGQMVLALTEVRTGSDQLGLFISGAARAPLDTLMLSARTGRFDEVPEDARQTLADIGDRHTAVARTAKLAVGGKTVDLTGKHRVQPVERPPPLRGTTTVYGVVVAVRLKKEGAASVTLAMSDTNAQRNAECEPAIAKKLAAQLGNEVGVECTAAWDAETLEIFDLHITRLTPYVGVKSIEELLEALKRLGPVKLDDDEVFDGDDDVWGTR